MRTWLSAKLAYPVFVWRFLKTHRSIRGVVVNVTILSILGMAFAPGVLLTIIELVARLGLMMGMMVMQFVALFWFLARSKSITSLPRPTKKSVTIRPSKQTVKDLGNGYGAVQADINTLTLEDYKGQPALLVLMQQWISILQGNENFRQMGGIAPSGMILHGAPGTGKSYLMKCLAGSANIAFHSLDGASFQAMFIGVPVIKMMSFVNKCRGLARDYGSCIGYIDEIDALGASRGGMGGMAMGGGMFGGGGGMGALTTFLSEIDGMGTERNFTIAKNIARQWLGLPAIHEGVVFWTGGTNRPQVLDSALTRPGRMEHLIKVDVPDAPGRKDIFSYYGSKVRHDGLDFDALVASTQGITPAAIQSALQRGAPRIANSDGRSSISQMDVMTAIMEGHLGIPNPIGDMPRAQKYQLAVHEASHCVASHHLSPQKVLAFVSVIRRGAALGFMLPIDKEATYTEPMANLVRDISVSLAGDVGCKVVLGERWLGGAGDFKHVRERIAYLDYHGYFGGVSPEYGKPSKTGQENIDKWFKEQLVATEDFLTKYKREVLALAEVLVERNELSGEEATKIIEEAV